MAANVETMMYVGETPWHGLGVKVIDAPTSEDAIKLAGLDWKVIQKEMYIKDPNGNMIMVPQMKANVRDIDGKFLGPVTDRYRIVQNNEAFTFTDELLGNGVRYESAGSLASGKRIWLLARMENTSTSNNQKFDLSKEVQMSVSVFESMIYEKKIKLETHISEGIEFNGDKEDIKHIISIILDNAIKHTEKNKKIIVNVQKEKNDIKIEIKNQGEPIPEEEQERIFERFYRVDKARNRSEKRYGLRPFNCKENSR